VNSFEKLLEIYPHSYTKAEHAQTFLWYHLRKHPNQRTAHLKEVQKYFRKADKPVPSIKALRQAFTGTHSQNFPAGTEPDTFGITPSFIEWWDRNFGSCFESE
jgi:hypothetical protein